VLEVVPGGQGAQNGVLVGDVISHVGPIEVGYDGSMQMDIKFVVLLSEARARGEPFITIRFNSGEKSADFKIKSRLTAALAPDTSPSMHMDRKKAMSKATVATASPYGTPSVVHSDADTVVSRCPSPSEHVRQLLEEGITVKEQREHERHEAQSVPAPDTDTGSSVNALFAKIAEEASSMLTEGDVKEANQDGVTTAEAGAADSVPLAMDSLHSALELIHSLPSDAV
jgi:hypothetical protein